MSKFASDKAIIIQTLLNDARELEPYFLERYRKWLKKQSINKLWEMLQNSISIKNNIRGVKNG